MIVVYLKYFFLVVICCGYRFNRSRKRAESISKSSLADKSNSLTAAQGSSTVEPTTHFEPQEELCTSKSFIHALFEIELLSSNLVYLM